VSQRNVYHCRMLRHEDDDMVRPFTVSASLAASIGPS